MSRASFLLVRRRLGQPSPRIVAGHDLAACSKLGVVLGTSAVFDSLRSLRNTRAVLRRHSLSSAASPGSAAAASSTSTSSSSNSNTGNVFLDYAGSIFLSAIGVIVVWLVRSYQNTQRRNIFRDAIEDAAPLDPLELDDLRTANTDTVTVEQFTDVMQELLLVAPQSPDSSDNSDSSCKELTYPQFVQRVRSIMMKADANNPAFTVQLGHLLDRVAVATLERHNRTLDDTMPVTFWLTLFSLALSASATDRIRVLYHMMQLQQAAALCQQLKEEVDEEGLHSDSRDSNNDNDTTKVTIDQVVELVGYLQDTCQLVPDAQVVATAHQYPLQEYAVGTPEQLVDRHRWVHHEALTPAIDYAAVASILRSKSVCAWGECYHKKKF